MLSVLSLGGPPLKILAISLGMDFNLREGCTPVWWQLFKALYEEGVEVVNMSLRGDSIDTLWWRSVTSPCRRISNLGSTWLKARKSTDLDHSQSTTTKIDVVLAKHIIGRSLEKKIVQILRAENDFDCVVFMSVDPRLVSRAAALVDQYFAIPVLFYEADMPVALPSYNPSSPYSNVDLSVFDAVITNSKGAEKPLKEIGALRVYTLYYGADPEVYSPLDTEEDIDVFFFGYGSKERKHWIDVMLNAPSLVMKGTLFSVGGNVDVVSSVRRLGDIPFPLYRRMCCRSKLSLNITRSPFAEVYGSSNVRMFELAALGRCVVMNPVLGIEEWFEPGKEIVMPRNEDEVLEIYNWLLESHEERARIGKSARERLLKEHTYRHRARQLISIIKSLV